MQFRKEAESGVEKMGEGGECYVQNSVYAYTREIHMDNKNRNLIRIETIKFGLGHTDLIKKWNFKVRVDVKFHQHLTKSTDFFMQ